MDDGKIAILAAGGMSLGVIGRKLEELKLKERGIEVVFVDKDKFTETKPDIKVLNQIEMDPMILEPCEPIGMFSSKHCRQESYYSKRIAKRRKKNKSRKTHRK